MRRVPLFFLALIWPFAGFAADALLAGQPVAAVLEAARAQGIAIVFNTQVVPDTLRVLTEPRAATGLPRIEEVLAQHGLRLTPVAEGVYAVVRPAGAPAGESPRPAAVAAPRGLEEVIVTTSRYALGVGSDPAHALISSEALKTLPRLGEDSLRAVQRLPGVAANGVGGLAAIRGGDPGETLVLLDGMTLYEPFHFKDFFSPVSLLDARFIGSLDFQSGGFGAMYGDRMSAVIDARSFMPGRRYYELGLSVFHLNGLASGTALDGRGRWLLSARKSNLDRVLSAVDPDLGTPKYQDGFLRAEYSVNEATELALNLLSSRDEINLNWERAGESAVASDRNQYLWMTLDRDWSATLASRLMLYYTDVNNAREGRVDDPGRRTGAVFDKRDFSGSGLDLTFSWSGFHGVHQWGAAFQHLEARYRYASRVRFEPTLLFPQLDTAETLRNLAVTPEGWKYSGYWSSRFELTESLATEVGVRLEDQDYARPEQSVQIGPRLSVLYAPGPATKLRASWGRFSQAQRIGELQLEDGIDTFFPAQRATHAVLGLDHAWRPEWRMRIEAYRKDYSHLRPRYENLFDPLVLLPELQSDRIAVTPSSARTRGVELSFSWQPLGPWSGWFSYSWAQAQDTLDGHAVLRSWDQKHALSAGVRWAKGRWDITLADSFHSGWPTTAVSLRTDSGGPVAVIGPRNRERLPSFNSLDLRASRRFALPRGELEAFLEITNLTNRENVCCVDYRVVTRAGATVLDAEVNTWLGVVPSIGVLWKY